MSDMGVTTGAITLDTIINFCVAAGTLLLAYYAYKNIASTKKQLLFLESQTKAMINQMKLLKNQINPALQVYDVKISKNTVSLQVNNKGTGNAFDIGILAQYSPVAFIAVGEDRNCSTREILRQRLEMAKDFRDVYSLESPDDQIKKWNELFNEGKIRKYYPKLCFSYINDNLFDRDNREIKDNSYVKYPISKYNNYIIASNEVNQHFSCTPFFNAIYVDFEHTYNLPRNEFNEVFSKGLCTDRFFDFDELLEIMKLNNIDFFNVVLDLVYKNQYEDLVGHIHLVNFVVSIKEHTTLEEAYIQRFNIGSFVSYRGNEQIIGGMPYYHYKNGTSPINSYEEISK
ncbi:hypothetical protein [Methanolobus psychrotolerans]|uniref:hypothetical protein n=1 Tax=Methanolobus psychrotolerans TaxID=1874706 RepID=UPI00101ADED9|nr:hypothetical protein [Methanolobus psychrotolerans]